MAPFSLLARRSHWSGVAWPTPSAMPRRKNPDRMQPLSAAFISDGASWESDSWLDSARRFHDGQVTGDSCNARVDHGHRLWYKLGMKEVAISVFKAKCLGILEEVRRTRK